MADKGFNNVNSISSAGVVTSILSSVGGVALSGPTGAAVDLLGNVYIADTGNNRVVTLTAAGGVSVAPVTGLNAPRGLAVDAAGDLFVADSGNARIVELSAAGAQTVVSPTTAFTTPVGVAVDAAGDLYVADSGSTAVYELAAGATTTTTLASGVTGLNGIAIDSVGDVFYSSTGSAGLNEVNRTTGSYTYPNTSLGQTSSQLLTLSNLGNATFMAGPTLVASTDSADFNITGAATNGCVASATLAPGTSCGLTAVFQPQSVNTLSDTVTFPGTTPATGTSIVLSGMAVGAASTATTTSLSVASPVVYGQTVMVVATVAPQSGTTAPVGTVTLTIDGSSTQSGTLSASGANGTRTFSVTSLQGGSHTFSAVFTPGAGFTASMTAANSAGTVTPATLTVTGVCANRIFGQVTTCSNATVAGYQYSDTLATVFATPPTSTTTAMRNSVAGSYAASPANTTLTAYGANDYTITAANGSFTIAGGAVQSILFRPLPNLPHGGTYQLSARTTSGLPVTYAVTAGSASISGSTLTVSGAGPVTVQATTAADPTGDYAAANPVSVSFTAP